MGFHPGGAWPKVALHCRSHKGTGRKREWMSAFRCVGPSKPSRSRLGAATGRQTRRATQRRVSARLQLCLLCPQGQGLGSRREPGALRMVDMPGAERGFLVSGGELGGSFLGPREAGRATGERCAAGRGRGWLMRSAVCCSERAVPGWHPTGRWWSVSRRDRRHLCSWGRPSQVKREVAPHAARTRTRSIQPGPGLLLQRSAHSPCSEVPSRVPPFPRTFTFTFW